MPGPAFGLFEINPDTGEVVTTVTFDREAQGIFTLRGKGPASNHAISKDAEGLSVGLSISLIFFSIYLKIYMYECVPPVCMSTMSM